MLHPHGFRKNPSSHGNRLDATWLHGSSGLQAACPDASPDIHRTKKKLISRISVEKMIRLDPFTFLARNPTRNDLHRTKRNSSVGHWGDCLIDTRGRSPGLCVGFDHKKCTSVDFLLEYFLFGLPLSHRSVSSPQLHENCFSVNLYLVPLEWFLISASLKPLFQDYLFSNPRLYFFAASTVPLFQFRVIHGSANSRPLTDQSKLAPIAEKGPVPLSTTVSASSGLPNTTKKDASILEKFAQTPAVCDKI